MIQIESLRLSQQLPEFLQKLSKVVVPPSFKQVQFHGSSKKSGLLCVIYYLLKLHSINLMDSKGEGDPSGHQLESLKSDLMKHLASHHSINDQDLKIVFAHRVDVDPAAHKSVFLSSKYCVISPAEVSACVTLRHRLRVER